MLRRGRAEGAHCRPPQAQEFDALACRQAEHRRAYRSHRRAGRRFGMCIVCRIVRSSQHVRSAAGVWQLRLPRLRRASGRSTGGIRYCGISHRFPFASLTESGCALRRAIATIPRNGPAASATRASAPNIEFGIAAVVNVPQTKPIATLLVSSAEYWRRPQSSGGRARFAPFSSMAT